MAESGEKRMKQKWTIKRIECMYCLMRYTEIMEAYDTLPEAEKALDQARKHELCIACDKTRKWVSLWDTQAFI